MRRQYIYNGCFSGMCFFACLALSFFCFAGSAEPVIVNSGAKVADAPRLKPTSYGRVAQNARIESAFVIPGTAPGQDMLFLHTSEIREESIGGTTPLFAMLNLTDGKFREVYADTPVKLREKPAADPFALDAGEAKIFKASNWLWGTLTCAAPGPDADIFLGVDTATPKQRPRLLSYNPRDDVFTEVTEINKVPAGLVYSQECLWFLTADGHLYFHDQVSGVEPVGRAVPGKVENLSGLRRDSNGWFYTITGVRPRRVHAFSVQGKKITQKRLLADVHVEMAWFRENGGGIMIETVVKDGGSFGSAFFQLQNGQAQTLPAPEPAGYSKHKDYELIANFAERPLRVSVRRTGTDWQHYPFVFSKTGWDSIKTLMADPQGKYVYGANWPVAWIWRFDPDTGRFHIYDRHYVFYEMQPWNDEIWVIGYWGIKLLRWKPDDIWTFDYSAHYHNKKFPGNTSPWGDKDVSNPRLVCKFRYLKDLQCRRPSGLAIGADGRAYVGGRTPAVEYFNSRHGGAVSWYDPAEETIGQIREPFLHHSVRDVCSAAGGRYIAVAASAYICMYEPLPEDFNRGKFVIYDTQEKKVVFDASPLGTALSYCEEGEPGRIVVASSGAFFIFDTTTMKVTHVVRVPFRIGWAEYNVLPFVRGPDRKIYFYGRSDEGTAMFRIDSVTGAVEPVLRAPGITDAATYNNPGAPFTFFKDRVYFGVGNLLSLPIEAVLGNK